VELIQEVFWRVAAGTRWGQALARPALWRVQAKARSLAHPAPPATPKANRPPLPRSCRPITFPDCRRVGESQGYPQADSSSTRRTLRARAISATSCRHRQRLAGGSRHDSRRTGRVTDSPAWVLRRDRPLRVSSEDRPKKAPRHTAES
jgi:hypothetical protein